jgi:hypothetical protein
LQFCHAIKIKPSDGGIWLVIILRDMIPTAQTVRDWFDIVRSQYARIGATRNNEIVPAISISLRVGKQRLSSTSFGELELPTKKGTLSDETSASARQNTHAWMKTFGGYDGRPIG